MAGVSEEASGDGSKSWSTSSKAILLADTRRSFSKRPSRSAATASLSRATPQPLEAKGAVPWTGNELAHQFSVETTTRAPSTTQYFSWWYL